MSEILLKMILTTTLLSAVMSQVTRGSDNCSSVENQASLAFALKRWYHVGCVVLVHSGSMASERKAVETNRLFSESGSLVSNVEGARLRIVSREFECGNNRPMFVVYVDDEKMEDVVRNFGEVVSYPRWLFFLDYQPANISLFRDVNIPFDCEMLVARCHGQEYQLTEAYRVAPNLPLNLSHFGTWNPESGLDATKEFLYARRTSLQGLVLSAAGVGNLALITFKRNKDNVLIVGGYFGRVITELANRLHFKLNLTELHEVPYGTLSTNGTWDGMVKMVIDGDLDIGIDDFTMNTDRTSVVQFLKPLILGRARLYIKKPGTFSLRWDNFLAPFSSRLWLGVLGSILLISYIFAASTYHQLERRHDLTPVPVSMLTCFVESFFSILGMFCQQGPSLQPTSTSSRAAFFLAGATSIIVLAAYSASLTSFITVTRADLPFDTIQGFVHDGSYSLGLPKNAIAVYFAEPRRAIFQELYTKFIVPNAHNLGISTAEGMAKLCTDRKAAWLTAMTFGQAFFSRLPCEVVSLPEYLLTDSQSMIIAKHSPYRRVLNHKIKFLQETGLLRYMYATTWPTPFRNEETRAPVVTMRHVLPVVSVLCAGALVGALLLLLETTTRMARRKWGGRRRPTRRPAGKLTTKKARARGKIRVVFREDFFQ